MTATPERRAMLLRALAPHSLLAKYCAVQAGEYSVLFTLYSLQ